jgi:hypothetical protein
MRKLVILSVILLLSVSETFAYALKVYDEYGNRVGTYRKEGDNYQLYDFYDKKVDNPDSLIQNAPNQKTLTEYSRTFYDENMIPIGTWHSGYYGNDGRYYPRGYEFYPSAWRRTRSPYIVRPNATDVYKYADYKDNVNYVDTRYPKFHKFRTY